MIVILVWDGLRPDMITGQRTPFLWKMARGGVFCRDSHAVFPTATRINSASLSTGCHPSRHGIVDNSLYVPAIDPDRAIQCADWRFLQAIADLEGGPLLDTPTIGGALRAAGKQMVSAGSGSPGTTYLTNPTLTGPIVNWATAWPEETQDEIQDRYGSFLDPESTAEERNAFVLRAVTEYLIPAFEPDLLTIWLTEPDHAQHRHGLGSPEALAALRALDGRLEGLVGALGGDEALRQHTFFLLSDHGFSTVTKRVAVRHRIAAAGLTDSAESTEVICDADSIYLPGVDPDKLGELLRFLGGEPWIGGLFVRDDLAQAHPEVMPQSAVFGTHRRSAEIMYALQWSSAENDYGVPGGAFGLGSSVATHGSASPYDVNNCLVAWGRGIKHGTTSSVPCSVIDVAPTALHLLGVPPLAPMDGRVLSELLSDGPLAEEVAVSRYTRERTIPTRSGPRQQVAWYSSVDGHSYMDRVTFDSPQS